MKNMGIIIMMVLVLLLVGVLNKETETNEVHVVKEKIVVSVPEKKEIDISFLKEANYWIYELLNNDIKSDNVARDYYAYKQINIGADKNMFNNLMLKDVYSETLKLNDVLITFTDEGRFVSIYVGNGYHVMSINGHAVIRLLKKCSIYEAYRVTEVIDNDKFIKVTAEIESNDTFITNKYYYGRYQIAKKYIPYYMKRLGMTVTTKPSEDQQKKIVSLIMRDSITFLTKNNLPVNTYSVRVVYNLGRTNSKRFIKGNLAIKLLNDNLPRKIEKTHLAFRTYWSKKVYSVTEKIS